jgi:hypothetical protein
MGDAVVISRAYDHSKEFVLFPEELPLALFYIVESRWRHFVDYSFVISVFPSFSVFKLLRRFESLRDVPQIADEVGALSDHAIVQRFRGQLALCRASGDDSRR